MNSETTAALHALVDQLAAADTDHDRLKFAILIVAQVQSACGLRAWRRLAPKHKKRRKNAREGPARPIPATLRALAP